MKLVAAMGVEMVNGKEITDIEALKKDYDYVVLLQWARPSRAFLSWRQGIP